MKLYYKLRIKYNCNNSIAVFQEVIEDTLRGEQAWVWGAWGRWSSCSKTCGGGVSVQTRECVLRSVMNENDSTASGLILTSSNALSSLRRSRCLGPAERYRECNTAPCPGSLPGAGRAQQCAAYDRRPFRGRFYHWVPYIDGNSPCTLNCRPLGKQFYATLALVADGTPCTKPGATAVCVQGVCKVSADLVGHCELN
ncbi:unnamed protein product [Plutella xylostella]|uniref:(diamondback moth) hypothetical protein n=1 Tax=Plutella xylostella TaxID=51655 RepID=A0A8S4F512_PLUXY|nr:unnamed protein product [Plutella xylostella]